MLNSRSRYDRINIGHAFRLIEKIDLATDVNPLLRIVLVFWRSAHPKRLFVDDVASGFYSLFSTSVKLFFLSTCSEFVTSLPNYKLGYHVDVHKQHLWRVYVGFKP